MKSTGFSLSAIAVCLFEYIKEITGVDIFNGEERLKIQMYMKFIECQQYTNK